MLPEGPLYILAHANAGQGDLQLLLQEAKQKMRSMGSIRDETDMQSMVRRDIKYEEWGSFCERVVMHSTA